MSKSALAAALLVASVISSSVSAQSSPSWRSAAERPERIEAPPEVETPDISFEIDREALFGRPMGFAPASERPESGSPKGGLDDLSDAPAASETVSSELVANDPESRAESAPPPAPAPKQTLSAAVSPAGPLTGGESSAAEKPVSPAGQAPAAKEAAQLAGEQPEASINVSALNSPLVILDPEMQFPAQESQAAPVNAAAAVRARQQAEEQQAVAREIRVDPELSMASINQPTPPTQAVAPPSPAAGYRLVRTRTVQPDYPRQAARLGEEGWVDLRLTVAPDGRVSQVDVLDAQPRQLFDAAARRAAGQWRFEPPADAGIDEPMSALIRLTFVMD